MRCAPCMYVSAVPGDEPDGDQAEVEQLASFVQGNWLFPKLQALTDANKAIGAIVKSLVPKVPTMSKKAVAGGFRRGAITTLVGQMPIEFAATVTGHDLTQVSALYEYVAANLSLGIPGSTVLAGWEPVPFGQLGTGPKPASLVALCSVGVTAESLAHVIDDVFSLQEGFSPPMAMAGGPLRPFIECAFATMVMYYQERCIASEMREVNNRLLDSCARLLGMLPSVANTTLSSWGSIIKAAFVKDNVRSRHECPEVSALQEQVAVLGQTVAHVGALVKSMHQELMLLRAALSAGLTVSPAATAVGTTATTGATTATISSEGVNSPPMGSVAAAAAAATAVELASAALLASAERNKAWGSLQAAGSRDCAPKTLAGVPLTEFYLQAKLTSFEKAANQLKSADRLRAKLAVEWMDAMATDEEMRQLVTKDTASGVRSRVVHVLEMLLRDYLLSLFNKLNTEPGKVDPKPMLVGTIETKIKQLKTQSGNNLEICSCSKDLFSQWRASKDVGSPPSSSPGKRARSTVTDGAGGGGKRRG